LKIPAFPLDRTRQQHSLYFLITVVCCESGGYSCGVAKESILLGYDTPSMGSSVMMFWFNIMSWSLRSECPGKILLEHFNLWRRNHVESEHYDHLPCDTVSGTWRPASSV